MAAGNLKKNRQVYLPFILTLTGMAAIFDIMGALAVSPTLDFMLGGGFMREILLMGERIVGIFSLIFLFYTNSFLLKRRKKEFGLYHILGMEKRHVALILVLGLSLAAEPVYLLSGRLAHPCLVPSRLRTALIILIVWYY